MSDWRESLRVVLASPRNPLNIGAAARAMSNFGFTHLRLVNAYEVAYLEARSAVNASAVLSGTEQFDSIAEAVADCGLVVGTASPGHRELDHSYRRLEYGGAAVRQALAAGARVAVLFGSEKFGLLNHELAHCHWLMRIPTRVEHESMNLGQAVAVCLYELIRSAEAVTTELLPIRSADAANMERFTLYLLDALRISGYQMTNSSDDKIRRMVRRLNLPDRDVVTWLGMIRQIVWKLSKR